MPKLVPEADRVEIAYRLALGDSKTQVCAAVGVARSTLRRLLATDPELRALIEAFKERLRAASLDLTGLVTLRSAELLAARLEEELRRVEAGEPPEIDLKATARIHREACEAERRAVALAMLKGQPGAPAPTVPVDTSDPDDPRTQPSTSDAPEPARDAAEWFARFAK